MIWIIGLIFALFAALRPGTQVILRTVAPPRSAPTDTGVWFVTGITEKGPVIPTLINSLQEYINLYGVRVSYGLLYDSLEAFFQEGGRRAYISRVVGPAAISATKNFNDAGAAVALTATALNPGAWGNSISVQIVAGGAGGTFVVVVTYNGVEVERSGDLLDTTAAIAWANYSNYIRFTQGASTNDPVVVAATPLLTGTDDRLAVTDAHWKIALDKFTSDLGPGQVSAPGRTSATSLTDLANHAALNYRVGLLDLPDSATAATLLAAVSGMRTGNAARFSSAFAPWAIIPGLTAGTYRVVPYSAIEAGIIARNDVGATVDDAAAGEMGQAVYAYALSQAAWDETTRNSLMKGGINSARVMLGGVRTYGFRSLVDENVDPDWIFLGSARTVMDVASNGNAILEGFMFAKVDGQGRLFSKVDGRMTAMLQALWEGGALYGETSGDAFLVDSVTPNTPSTIAAGELRCTVAIRVSPMAEFATLELIKVPVSQSL